ncbi:MAG: hypothetical protein Q9221_007498 [Calogaya cf. arnoldii]
MSQAHHQYKFNPGDDPNDPGMLAKAIGKMKLRQPETYGGKLLDSTKTGRQYDEFNTHTPPDITSNTRIVAVCGIRQDQAAPSDDGWFLSDFFAFHHLFTGLTTNQVWMHCLNLRQLVQQHKPYLHGSPYKPRKIVMDDTIIKHAKDLVHSGTAGGLRLMFKQTMRKECEKAAQAGNESVLVLMFGHGDLKNGGIELGNQWFKQQQLSETFAGLDVPVTILSTACYSGGWSCNKIFDKKTGDLKSQFNKSTIMAAGNNAESHSWNFTATLGRRACGSVFASVFVEAMTRVNNRISLRESAEESNQVATQEQESTYADFCETVTKTLLMDYDRLGFEHDVTFSAENDAWNMCWRERTGIPLGQFRERWDQLEDHDPDPYLHPGDPYNKDPHVTSEQAADYNKLKKEDAGKNVYGGKKGSHTAQGSSSLGAASGKRKISGLYGGTVQALINQVSYLGGQYLNSYRGFTNTGNDGALYNLINRIQLGEEKDQEAVEYCLRCIQYRMEHMATADRYLQMMAVPAPLGQACHEFDSKVFRRSSAWDREVVDLIFDREVLFPAPLNNMPALNQGRPFYKGVDYLDAAFFYAKIPRATIIEKLDNLAASVNEVFEEEEERFKQVPELKSKRQKLYHAFRINPGSVSPWKRRSRGQSLGSGS